VLSSRTAGKGRQGVGVPVVLVAGEGPDEDLGTWRRAAATAGRPPSRRQEEETEGEREGVRTLEGEERKRGRLAQPTGYRQDRGGSMTPRPPGGWSRTGPSLSGIQSVLVFGCRT
jgi:hypothetical protein